MGLVCGFSKQRSLARGTSLANYRHHEILSSEQHSQGSALSVAPGCHIACETLGLRGAAQTRPLGSGRSPPPRPREGELWGVPEGLSLGTAKGKDPGKVLDWGSDREGETRVRRSQRHIQ